MSLTKIYDFIDPDDFTNTSKIANGSLVLQDDPGNDFEEDFADDTDFTYDSDYSEFSSGQVQQKDQRQTGATFGVSYTANINGSWGDGVLTGTATGGASVSGGKLDLTGGGVKYVDYDADANADSQQVGCVRLKYTPNYNGSPPTDYPVFSILKADGDTNNIIMFRHETSGIWKIYIEDYIGALIMSASLPSWSATLGVEVELELNWDLTTGATRLFIDGTQWGTTQTDTGTRDSNITVLRIGSNYSGVQNMNAYIDDILIFPTVQHTSNYTSGYTVVDYVYAETEVLLPEMEYTGVGTLVAVTDFVTSFGGSPRITLEIGRSGDELYWDGAQWAVSNETYDQATDPATFAANVASLPVTGEIYGQFKIYFTNSNNQSSFDNLLITLTAQIYPIDDPYIISNVSIGIDNIDSITEAVTKTGSDDISRVCIIAGSPYYYDGASWVTSDYSYAQSNSASEIIAAIDALDDIIGNGATFAMAYIFHSNDGSTTPSITTDIIVYDFFGGVESAPNECIIYGTMRDEDGDAVENGVVTISSSNTKALYNNNILTLDQKTVLTRSNGYWEAVLPETTNMDIHFIFTFSNDNTHREYPRIIPNEDTKGFGDLEAPS